MARLRPAEFQSAGREGSQLFGRWWQGGDLDALDELLRLELRILKDRIRAKGRGLASSPESVSDVAQEAVLRVLSAEELPRLRDRKVFSAYLWRTAWRLLIDRLRQRKHAMVRIDSRSSGRMAGEIAVAGGQSGVERRDVDQQVALILTLMRAEDRRILELRFMRGLSFEEIGKRLEIGSEAARMRLTRARQRMARKLKGWQELLD